MEQIVEAGATVTPRDGNRLLVRIIDVGKGSSGIYPEETLQRAADEGVFDAGLHLYADHPGEAERFDRPERSIRDIAGVLTSAAVWDPESKSLVAEARTYDPWTATIRDMHDVIGLSIRASAEVSESDSGERVIERITEAQSVDFVTRAGRGGRILSLLESTRSQIHETTPEATMTEQNLSEAARAIAELSEARDEIRRITGELEEARNSVDELTHEREALQEALAASRTTARASAAEAILAESGAEFTTLERRALLADLPVVADGHDLDAASFKAAVDEAAQESATRSGGGSVRGLGGAVEKSTDVDDIDIDAYIREAFGRTVNTIAEEIR